MSKITKAGSGFVKIDGHLINLKDFKSIKKVNQGIGDDAMIGIEVTPNKPSQEDIDNGVDGSYFISMYDENSLAEMDEDYQTITDSLK